MGCIRCREWDAVTKWNRDSISVNFYLLLLLPLSVSLLCFAFILSVCPFALIHTLARFLWASFISLCVSCCQRSLLLRVPLLYDRVLWFKVTLSHWVEFSMRNKQHELVAMALLCMLAATFLFHRIRHCNATCECVWVNVCATKFACFSFCNFKIEDGKLDENFPNKYNISNNKISLSILNVVAGIIIIIIICLWAPHPKTQNACYAMPCHAKPWIKYPFLNTHNPNCMECTAFLLCTVTMCIQVCIVEIIVCKAIK